MYVGGGAETNGWVESSATAKTDPREGGRRADGCPEDAENIRTDRGRTAQAGGICSSDGESEDILHSLRPPVGDQELRVRLVQVEDDVLAVPRHGPDVVPPRALRVQRVGAGMG